MIMDYLLVMMMAMTLSVNGSPWSSRLQDNAYPQDYEYPQDWAPEHKDAELSRLQSAVEDVIKVSERGAL